jgi:branched-chain amino acid transport system permease protein
MVFCLVLVLLPAIIPSYLQSMLTKFLIFSIFALSLNLIWGYTGMISLGHGAFFGVGGYTAAILILRFGKTNFLISGIGGILMAGLIAALFGIIALRVSGIYFLLVTLALGQLMYYIAMVWRPITGGSDGLLGIPFPDFGVDWFAWNESYFYYFVLVIFILCFFILNRIVKSPFGYALRGVRDQESRMRCLGHNTWLIKYIAFVIAGIFAGVAGVLFGHYLGMLHPLHIGVTTSTIVLLMVIVGSSRVIYGPIIGAGLVVFLEYFASLYMPARWPMILGAVFVIAVLFLRGGISIYLEKLFHKASQ